MQTRTYKVTTAAIVFISLALLLLTNYMMFFYVPNERIMGPVQRIFYLHVGSAMAAYLAMLVIFASSLSYLATKKPLLDAITEAAAEVGLLFCSIVMVTGMIWGNAAWNTPFRLEPRLVSSLILWMIFVAFVVLRSFSDRSQLSDRRIANNCAVLGIIGAVMVPVVIYSVHILPQVAQLHPVVVENRGLKDPRFGHALGVATIALCLFSVTLIWMRARIGQLERVLVTNE